MSMSHMAGAGAASQPSRRPRPQNLDISVILRAETSAGWRTIHARGRHLCEGGIAIFAGAELAIGDTVELEFTPPYARLPVKLKAEIRCRNEYYYGLAFVASNAKEQKEISLLRLFVRAITAPPSELVQHS